MSAAPRFRRWPTEAGRSALRAYRQLPLGARLHSLIRWWSAPFAALEAHVPTSGRILEVGCGRGLLCTYLALARPDRIVLGVDIDQAKIEQAAGVARKVPGLDFAVTASGAVPGGPWDAILVVDMLYLMPARQQRELLAAAVTELAPGGMLLIKEMSPTPRWKARVNLLQETLAVSVLGLSARANQGSAGNDPVDDPARRAGTFDFVPPEQLAGWLQDLGLACVLTRLDRHRLHPHHLIAARSDLPVS